MDYIKVSKNETYYANEYVPVVAAYDKDKKSIGYIRNTLTGGSFNTGNAVYIRARNNVQLSTEEEIQNAIDKAMIIKGSTSSDYIEHQSQTAIMPIQQEMLEGDYVADVEHHEWRKYEITGNETIRAEDNAEKEKTKRFDISISNIGLTDVESISNYFKTTNFANRLQDAIQLNLYTNQIMIRMDKNIYDDVTKFKSWLKSKYDEGNPVTIYYKLATPINLELTAEQKAVRNQKLYTYKNITNIDVSDELASIDVEYKKDPTTEHDDLQNQIDEIKQLLSTTETSAFLVNNLEKELESEVN